MVEARYSKNVSFIHIVSFIFSLLYVGIASFDNREEAFSWLYANLLIKVNLVFVLQPSSRLLKRFSMKNFCYTL